MTRCSCAMPDTPPPPVSPSTIRRHRDRPELWLFVMAVSCLIHGVALASVTWVTVRIQAQTQVGGEAIAVDLVDQAADPTAPETFDASAVNPQPGVESDTNPSAAPETPSSPETEPPSPETSPEPPTPQPAESTPPQENPDRSPPSPQPAPKPSTKPTTQLSTKPTKSPTAPTKPPQPKLPVPGDDPLPPPKIDLSYQVLDRNAKPGSADVNAQIQLVGSDRAELTILNSPALITRRGQMVTLRVYLVVESQTGKVLESRLSEGSEDLEAVVKQITSQLQFQVSPKQPGDPLPALAEGTIQIQLKIPGG
ncbi:MAG: hypothetical protein VKJ24_13500 [Synechococcales bacterium]|nr:hypothetical protein [Synechococcales bacterium]